MPLVVLMAALLILSPVVLFAGSLGHAGGYPVALRPTGTAAHFVRAGANGSGGNGSGGNSSGGIGTTGNASQGSNVTPYAHNATHAAWDVSAWNYYLRFSSLATLTVGLHAATLSIVGSLQTPTTPAVMSVQFGNGHGSNQSYNSTTGRINVTNNYTTAGNYSLLLNLSEPNASTHVQTTIGVCFGNCSAGNTSGGNGSGHPSAGSYVMGNTTNASYTLWGMSAWNGTLTVNATVTLPSVNFAPRLTVNGTVAWPNSPARVWVLFGDGSSFAQNFGNPNNTTSSTGISSFATSHLYVAQGRYNFTIGVSDRNATAQVATPISVVLPPSSGNGSNNSSAGSRVVVLQHTNGTTVLQLLAWNGSLVVNATARLAIGPSNATAVVNGTVADALSPTFLSVLFGNGYGTNWSFWLNNSTCA
ncbi:MAG: hypothetical protein ACHQ16_03015, partial [Candidatus Lutacidiplasmatales archaeon]